VLEIKTQMRKKRISFSDVIYIHVISRLSVTRLPGHRPKLVSNMKFADGDVAFHADSPEFSAKLFVAHLAASSNLARALSAFPDRAIHARRGRVRFDAFD
jgi:hypothetical protein